MMMKGFFTAALAALAALAVSAAVLALAGCSVTGIRHGRYDPDDRR
jgi:hypothetical protein